MGISEILKKYIPDEIVDGSNVKETAEMVDLDIAHKLLVVEQPRPAFITPEEAEIDLFGNPPQVTSSIKKRPDGQYQIDQASCSGPDFKVVDESEVKVMRARFLLLKGFYSQNFNKLTLPKQNEVAVQYDIQWIPPEDMFK